MPFFKALQADLSEQISDNIITNEKFILFEKIGNTDAEDYKLIKHMIEESNKNILYEVLV